MSTTYTINLPNGEEHQWYTKADNIFDVMKDIKNKYPDFTSVAITITPTPNHDAPLKSNLDTLALKVANELSDIWRKDWPGGDSQRLAAAQVHLRTVLDTLMDTTIDELNKTVQARIIDAITKHEGDKCRS